MWRKILIKNIIVLLFLQIYWTTYLVYPCYSKDHDQLRPVVGSIESDRLVECLKRFDKEGLWTARKDGIGDFVASLGIMPGDKVIEVGTSLDSDIGLLTFAYLGEYLGFDLRYSIAEHLKKITQELVEKAGFSDMIGGVAEQKKENFITYSQECIPDSSVRFIFGITGVVGDPHRESNTEKVIDEMLRIIQNGGEIISGQYTDFGPHGESSQEYEEKIICKVLDSPKWEGKIKIELIASEEVKIAGLATYISRYRVIKTTDEIMETGETVGTDSREVDTAI